GAIVEAAGKAQARHDETSRIVEGAKGGGTRGHSVARLYTIAPSRDAMEQAADPEEGAMNEDTFNTSIRRFLKTLGVTGQREIEKAVRAALADGRLKGNEKLSAKATITIGAVTLTHVIEDTIALE